MDIQKHNAGINKVWEAYQRGHPIRVPVTGGIEIETFLTMQNYGFKRYYSDPEFMVNCQLEKQKWCRENIFADTAAGLPEAWDSVTVDFWPVIAEGWLGCEVVFPENGTPWAKPLLKDNKEKLYELDIPDPIHGNFMQRVYEFYEVIKEKVSSRYYCGLPVNPHVGNPGEGTCGVFSDAVNLRGANELMGDMYDDPRYVHRLLTFITDATIQRKKAWRKMAGEEKPGKDPHFKMVDHGIDMLSADMYREFVLPYHKKLLNAFAGETSSISLHHCGKGLHLFKTIHDELGVRTFFNLTYPFIDVAGARRELGGNVYLGIGLHPEIVLSGPVERIDAAVKSCLTPELKAGGRLYWIQGDFFPPKTPLAHIYAVYESVRKYGTY